MSRRTTSAYEISGRTWRVLWWTDISFTWMGWLPILCRNFQGGYSTVLAWGRLWIQWGMVDQAGEVANEINRC